MAIATYIIKWKRKVPPPPPNPAKKQQDEKAQLHLPFVEPPLKTGGVFRLQAGQRNLLSLAEAELPVPPPQELLPHPREAVNPGFSASAWRQTSSIPAPTRAAAFCRPVFHFWRRTCATSAFVSPTIASAAASSSSVISV